MRCRKARKLISSAVDGPLGRRNAADLEKHIETCPECRGFEAELRSVVRAASRLERPEPSEAVWDRIRTGINRTASLSPGPTGPRRRLRRFSWGSWGLSYAGAALLAITLIVSGILVVNRLDRPGSALSLNDRAAQTLAKLDEAEGHYLKALEALGEAFTSQQGALMPEVAEMFARNLEVIDASIQACRRAVLAEPEDLQARGYLMAAYMEKISFLNTALEYPRRAPVVLDPGRGY